MTSSNGKAQLDMSITKHRLFVEGAMGSKHVMAIPGIDDEAAKHLASNGIIFAYQLYGHFLIRFPDNHKFQTWLFGVAGRKLRMNELQDCCTALQDWKAYWQ
ncbi:hypothetical protein ScPMuIL_010099 [Solemya velum]